MKKTNIGISLLTALLLGATAQADMITMGGDQTAGTGTLTINQDLVFHIIGNAHQLIFVFDEIVTSDGSADFASFNGLQYSINGGAALNLVTWGDNFASTSGSITPNDGVLFSDPTSVSAGDTLTLLAGTGTMTNGVPPTFNPWSSGNYNVFVAAPDGTKINGVVPEPATAGLLGISALVLFGIRRLKKTYGIR